MFLLWLRCWAARATCDVRVTTTQLRPGAGLASDEIWGDGAITGQLAINTEKMEPEEKNKKAKLSLLASVNLINIVLSKYCSGHQKRGLEISSILSPGDLND